MASEPEAQSGNDCLREIESLRAELHRRMCGQYDPEQMARLVDISQELDRLVVEYTRMWLRSGQK